MTIAAMLGFAFHSPPMSTLLLDGAELLQTELALTHRFRPLAEEIAAMRQAPPAIPGRRGRHHRYPLFAITLPANRCREVLAALEWLASCPPMDLDEREWLARAVSAWQGICTAVA